MFLKRGLLAAVLAVVGLINLGAYFTKSTGATSSADHAGGPSLPAPLVDDGPPPPSDFVQADALEPVPMICALCGGSGRVSCNYCLGTGELQGTGNPYQDPPTPPARCPVCGGTGEKTCPECHGTGMR